jgi:hypothetical protein
VFAGLLGATVSISSTRGAYVTHNVTLSETVTNAATATAARWYSLDELTKFIFQLLIPTTTASVCAAVAGAYAARRDVAFAARVGIGVAIVVTSLILLVVFGLSQMIIPIVRAMSNPFSPELGLYSSIIAACLVGGFVLLYATVKRASLRIRKIELVTEQFDEYRGYIVKASVESLDRRVIYDMSALLQIEGDPKQLLRVDRYEDNGRSTVRCSLEPFRASDYAWSAPSSPQKRVGNWPELRTHDRVFLTYPEEEVATGVIGPAIYGSQGKFMSMKTYLSLKSGVRYQVKVQVKGVDVNKNTISGRKAIAAKIP